MPNMSMMEIIVTILSNILFLYSVYRITKYIIDKVEKQVTYFSIIDFFAVIFIIIGIGVYFFALKIIPKDSLTLLTLLKYFALVYGRLFYLIVDNFFIVMIGFCVLVLPAIFWRKVYDTFQVSIKMK